MRDIMDLKLFFDLDSDIRLARRTIRDISDRSRQIETVLDRYLTFVKPAFDTYIKPTRKYADFVIPQDNFSSLPVEIISQHLSNTLVDIKKNNEEFNKKKECKLSQEECVSKKYFYNPEISCLSVVKEEKEIRKFNKIIHHIIERTKTSFYSLYCNVIVQYLLETQKKKNENNRRIFYFDETQLNNNHPIIQNIKEEKNNCIISIFAPILIQMKEKFKMDLIRFINEFKERKVQFELLSVYMSYNTFNQLNEVLACNNVSMNFITIYFGDDLLKNKTILENGGFISSNSVDLLYHFITPENLINEFHLNENN
jgi:hypothetical protein